MELNFETIENLVNLATDKNLAELTIEQDDQKVTIKTAVAGVVVSAPVAAPVPAAAAPAPAPAPEAAAPVSNYYKVTSPMVGTYYASPAPDAAAFVQVGAPIGKGQTLCIIEAMKLMNELESEVSGIVRKVLIENAQPVEFGQVLMEIEVQS